MKVKLVTPAGTVETEIPSDTECIRIGFYPDDDQMAIAIYVTAEFKLGDLKDIDVAQHLLSTSLAYEAPQFSTPEVLHDSV
jgi:hypothetical protein